MAIVVPDRNQAIVEDNGVDLRITMRVKSPSPVTAAVGVGLVVCVSAEITGFIALWNGAPREGVRFQLPWMTEEIARGPDFASSMLSWLVFVGMICVLLAVIFMWSYAGKEIIELNSRTLKLIRKIPVFSYGTEYPIAEISNLRLVPFPWTKERKFTFFGLGDEAIAFDCGDRTRLLGVSLDEANALYVIEEMRKRVTSLGQQ